MKFSEFDTVRILKDDGDTVKKGDVGAVLMVFEKPREAYEVEVFDESGKPKTQCTFLPDDLELVKY
ncbi:MAG: DUF4926 domain-containing protein [Butyrivibrio sp.]|nr:DUF4926 domain-containing protein [Butyrivibrio sp.]